MIASNEFASYVLRRKTDKALARVPQRAFGDTAWVAVALQSSTQYLAPAIASGNPHRIANAARAIAHAPTAEQINDVIGAACEAVLADAYASGDADLISNVAGARSVIGTVISEIRERSERERIAPALLRETVNGYIQIVALLNERLAERLDAVGLLAARIGSAMHLPASTVLDIEFAGRLHDIGALSFPGTTSRAEATESHSIAGETFLRNIPSLAHLALIVRSQAERFDGLGKPDGLRGAEIPLASRIVSVAAAFVGSVTDSPLRAAARPDDACHELLLAAGTRFDPDVVAATLHLLRVRQRTNRSA
jgi:HD-GYP domain-containing protein (c-di-GMP phosphodiesterase class II)